MHLILDFGNSQIKQFVYQKETLIATVSSGYDTLLHTLQKTNKAYPKISHILIADVWGKAQETVVNVFDDVQILMCSLALKMPFTTAYESRTTLGADRIALLAAMHLNYPGQNVLGIDLGSCITYDLLDTTGHHHGGSISPGFQMRYKSLHEYTGQLPKLTPKPFETPLGTSTEKAMHAGIYQGILYEIEGQIEFYKAQFENLTVIFVGGDAQRLPIPFKNGIFAAENFSAEGLRHILKINS